nr:hypothetical protein CFP56_00428 [Quercus suber]
MQDRSDDTGIWYTNLSLWPQQDTRIVVTPKTAESLKPVFDHRRCTPTGTPVVPDPYKVSVIAGLRALWHRVSSHFGVFVLEATAPNHLSSYSLRLLRLPSQRKYRTDVVG